MLRRTLYLLLAAVMAVPFILEIAVKIYVAIPLYWFVTGRMPSMRLYTGELMDSWSSALLKNQADGEGEGR